MAEDLELPFWDLDAEIETRTGQTIPQIFAAQGEPGFRRLERETLESVLVEVGEGEAVIALGGGALLDPQVRAQVESLGPVLFLDASLEVLAERLQTEAGQRPLLANQPGAVGSGDEQWRSRLEALLEQRAGHYASFPLRIATNWSAEIGELSQAAQTLLGRFRVRGMGDAYDVCVAPGGLSALGAALVGAGCEGPVALVTDDHVAPFWAQQAQAGLEAAGYRSTVITLPAGEANKTLESVQRLWEGFLAAGLERRSTVVALGGGVVGDLSGFAAATFLRGVPWVAVPTTLLAMVDASLGGKTGADLPQGKNLIGAFHPPRLVLVDPDTLATLPEAELRGGLAEVVKHGLISDPALFDLCRGGLDRLRQNWAEVVRRAAAVKVQVIQEDPFERGRRASLNLGHTFGHAVELVSGFRLSHGEAVAIGLVAAARLSERLGIASQPQLSELVIETLQDLGLPTEIPSDLPRQELLAAMQVDKKRAGGKVRFVLPVRVGEVVWGIEAPDELLPI